jgi:hypothetical protein
MTVGFDLGPKSLGTRWCLGVVVVALVVVNVFWMREVFYVLRWNIDVQLGLAFLQTALLALGIANLKLQNRAAWVVFLVVFFALSSLAAVNCLDVAMSIALEQAGPPSDAVFAPFAYMSLCTLAALLLRIDRGVLYVSYALLFSVAAVLLMQKYGLPNFYLT